MTNDDDGKTTTDSNSAECDYGVFTPLLMQTLDRTVVRGRGTIVEMRGDDLGGKYSHQKMCLYCINMLYVDCAKWLFSGDEWHHRVG